MGGHQIPGMGTSDDGYDEDGYDESQRAEILEATGDGPTDGAILTDMNPDLGQEPLADDGDDDALEMLSDEVGEEDDDADAEEEDLDEDDAQVDFEDGAEDADEELDDGEDVALKP
ncbi:DNA primase [Sphingomonas sp. RS2018]